MGEGAHHGSFEGEVGPGVGIGFGICIDVGMGLFVVVVVNVNVIVGGDEGEKQLAFEEKDSFVELHGFCDGGFVGVHGRQGPGKLLQSEDEAEDIILMLAPRVEEI